jgi:hypothetical protein
MWRPVRYLYAHTRPFITVRSAPHELKLLNKLGTNFTHGRLRVEWRRPLRRWAANALVLCLPQTSAELPHSITLGEEPVAHAKP